jgi:acyl-CoA synthetase (AMP-forming)/AMP-acid ligase II
MTIHASPPSLHAAAGAAAPGAERPPTTEERRRLYREQGSWGDTRLQDLFDHWVATRPNACSVVDPPDRARFTEGAPRRVTWQELGDGVKALSGVLLDAGYRRGDVVLLQLPSVHEFFVAYLACFRLGLVASPVPVAYRAHELAHIVPHARVRGLIGMGQVGGFNHGELLMQMAHHPEVRQVMLWGDDLPEGAVDLGAAMRRQAQDPTLETRLQEATRGIPVTADDVCLLLWTSGTEALPKPVPRTHNHCLVARKLMTEPASLEIGDCLLSPRLLNTMGGFAGTVMTWLDCAAQVVLHQPLNLPLFLQQIADERPVFTSGPPALLQQLMADPHAMQLLANSPLRCISSGSAALPEEVMLRFKRECGIDILNFYGSSEGGSLSATPRDMDDLGARARYFARFGAPNCESTLSTARYVYTRLIDPETEVSIEQPGVVGELCFDGPTLFNGYLGMPEATEVSFTRRGEYRSGDLFEIAGDRGQWLRFVGRRKEIIVRGGMNISALEVEGLLAQVPGIREVAAVGLPDERLGEIVCAVVVLAPDMDLDLPALTRHLQETLSVAIYKCPEALLRVESLPRNPAGKVLKATLRQQAQDASLRGDDSLERRGQPR